MLRAYVAKDRNEAIKIYERILKAEKDNKELQITPFAELIKTMREKKVFEWQSAA